MATKRHDFIVSAIARKMRTNGFEIIYLDGKFQDIGIKRVDIPPKIINHKPDIIGAKGDLFFCIGEAKTENDIYSYRTRNQIIDFLAIVKENPRNRLILGIPLKSKLNLERLLMNLEIINQEQIEIICIPEELFPYEESL